MVWKAKKMNIYNQKIGYTVKSTNKKETMCAEGVLQFCYWVNNAPQLGGFDLFFYFIEPFLMLFSFMLFFLTCIIYITYNVQNEESMFEDQMFRTISLITFVTMTLSYLVFKRNDIYIYQKKGGNNTKQD